MEDGRGWNTRGRGEREEGVNIRGGRVQMRVGKEKGEGRNVKGGREKGGRGHVRGGREKGEEYM